MRLHNRELRKGKKEGEKERERKIKGIGIVLNIAFTAFYSSLFKSSKRWCSNHVYGNHGSVIMLLTVVTAFYLFYLCLPVPLSFQ